jgi:hypothetical protein
MFFPKNKGKGFFLSYNQRFKFGCIADTNNNAFSLNLSIETVHDKDSIKLPFEEGETLIYDVYSAGIKTGQSFLTFHGEKPFNGESAYYITFITELPFFKDYEYIYAQRNSFLPLKIIRKIEKMGGLSTEEIEEEYDQAAFNITIWKKGMFSTDKAIIQKKGHIYNAILLTYLCRPFPETAYEDSFKAVLPTQEFDIKLSGQENIKSSSGEYFVDVFKSQPPKFTFYLSKDKRRLPVKITSHTALDYTMLLSAVEMRKETTEFDD